MFRRGCSRQIRRRCFDNLKKSSGKEDGRGPRVSLQNPAAAADEEDPGSPAGRGASAATTAAAADGTVRDLLIGYY